ncbi:hypothetical protein NC651_020731 [Populus alba x Populus x berolinensis]|nr:hypothetical protein NC651_020731 [Populus alba x Populus x berolinensis]
MMERSESSSKMTKKKGFVDTIFSWSLEDIFNENLFKCCLYFCESSSPLKPAAVFPGNNFVAVELSSHRVENIPESFYSVEHYLGSYEIPLLEETRAELSSSMNNISTAPFAFFEAKPQGTLLYDVNIDYWRNRSRGSGKEHYKTLPGDIVILTCAKPENVSDLQSVGWTWTFAVVTNITGDETEDAATYTSFTVKAQKDIEISDGLQKSLTVVSLTNITTSKRIWNALHMSGKLNIIKEILCTDSVVEENCNQYSMWERAIYDENVVNLSSKLNESQSKAVLACLLKKQRNHKSTVELIWGPPGTGKTKTVSVLLFSLLKMKCRTLTCAPTNVSITEVASRVLKLVTESHEADSGTDSLFHSVGDILLFGNKDRLKVDSETQEVYLDYRVKRLKECFALLTGRWNCFKSTIDFFEDCVSQYAIFEKNELIKMQEHGDENEEERESCSYQAPALKGELKTFLEFMRDGFRSTALPLKTCLALLCTHIPETCILKHNIQNIVFLFGSLNSFESWLFHEDVISDELLKVFSHPGLHKDSFQGFNDILLRLRLKRSECLTMLKRVRDSLRHLDLPGARNKRSIEEFCFQKATLFFCTASSSYKLHWLPIEPLNFLVVDEAAQLKECESTIPLQLPGIRHAILIGDECQLPAMVVSNVCDKAGFGRSLFERLGSLGHSKHLLDMQYRMHPSISCFPNSKFYFNKILDAPNVKARSYEKHYLPGPMFGPYTFINVFGGREELDDVGHSRKNMVEVAIVLKLLQSLYKAWSGKKVRVGVISPYTAQVGAIQEKLGEKYENIDGFSVKVSSIDGFQGGEEDIVIISTVRSHTGGRIGFMSDPRRINVALTRARHCLWILGNERTLSNSQSIWEKLVHDAKERNCFFNADEDKDLAKAILEVKKEFDQLDDLIKGDSALFFRSARWKVVFSEYFKKSFGKLASVRKKTLVLYLLLKLSSGWRPKKRNVDFICGSSSQILKQFKVEGLYVICSIDLVKEIRYKQVLKVWDLLPLEDIPILAKRLEGIFKTYTDDFISHCNEKCLEGDLEVPKIWTTSFDIPRCKSCSNNEKGSNSNPDGSYYVENSKVSDSLLLMKFYPISCGVVSHLLSDRDGRELELPFEVTDEEFETIIFPRSTFILGRSGTGKTTVLTMKLFKKEELYYTATQGYLNTSEDSSRRNNVADDIKSVGDGVGDAKETVLRQLLVTASPKLCYAIKHRVIQLKSFASGGKYSAEESSVDMEDIDDAAQFKDIPNSFVDIPPKSYPLVITFFKFLMMLDGTMGNSYFERFSDMRQLLHEKVGNSGSISAQTLIRTKEVNFEKFCAVYWPRFNEKFKKKLDSSRVFTEIISHIKGGLRPGESCDGRLNREDYVFLSKGHKSTLNRQNRDLIYDIFEDYEKMKAKNGDFDMADFVNDLHLRLKTYKYEGDAMDFVYIDEVQDLTMRQIALFKYICRNVDEGFVFSGDTAQTIARGVDFRFEDIKFLFYNEFVLASRSAGNGRSEKGQISEIFHLQQNFRTHAGVLNLAQSVIDLLYRFFSSFIDVLSHETSLISGEAPILLESRNDENAIVTIFGNSGNVRSNFVGFGAEQVILVRDDAAKKEIDNYVRKHALVLTVIECKGLEFQDVLLYNFFGSSPSKNKWRVVYEFMKEQDLLDANSPSFPSFDPAKHNVLCSELKQLYVAITRTRQRLWICENVEEFSRPMFDYWMKKGLVQVRKLDDSLAREMQVSSSPEEWKSQGYKLLHEGKYEMAAMCFERGCNFSKCLSACTKGKLFDTGLHYIQCWRQHGTADQRSREMDTIEQEFLESCACHYYELNDNRAMMKYVRAFDSMSSARTFLTNLGCLDELLSLEVESCNFLEAAGIAKLKGHLVLEADLLGRGGHFKEASLLILWFVFANSLWSTGSKGWPLKQFLQKEELLTKAKLLAKDVSDQFCEFVHTEAEILLNSQHNLFKIHQSLESSRRHISIRGEILSARKILDMHLHLNTSEYWWENDLVSDVARLSERNFLNNQVSAETLVYIWNFWKYKIVNIFKFLGRLERQDVTEYGDIGEFCLNYLGVKRQFNNLNSIYFLMISDAQWVRDIPRKFIQRKGNLVSVDVHEFVTAAQDYWCSELLSVGMNVLTNLEALYNLSVRNSLSLFCQSRSLTHIYEVANFLLNCQFLSSQHGDIKALQKFTQLATRCFYDCIYPRDWRESLKENMISLRRTEICRNLLKEVIFEDVSSTNNLSYAQLGRITSMILGSGEMVCEPFEKMADGLQWNSTWKAFIEDLCRNVSEVSYIGKLHEALVDTYNANWGKGDYILPGCFLYMLERQLILLSYFQGYCFTTKSSFVEWLIYQEGHGSPTFESLTGLAPQSTESILKFIVDTVHLLLYNEKDMMECIRVSEKNVKVLNDYHAVVVLRLVVIICLIYVNFGWCEGLLSDLLGRTSITKKLPSQFYDAIRKRQKYNSLNVNPTVVAEAFSKIGNPLDEGNPPLRHERLWEIFEALKSPNHGVDERSKIACDPTFKVDIDRITCLLKAAIDGNFQNPPGVDNKNLLEEASTMLHEMRQLDAALEMREPEHESDISTIGELLEKLLSRRPRMEFFLSQIF